MMPDCEWIGCLESAAYPHAYPLFCQEHWREVMRQGDETIRDASEAEPRFKKGEP